MEQTTKTATKLSEILLADEPPKVNKQLFENSDLSALYAHEVEAGRAPKEDDFFNSRGPNLAILTEKPEHRLAIFLKARGHSLSEIADATGFTVPWVSQILRQPWARARLAQEINAAGREELSTLIEGAAKDAMMRLIDIAEDGETPANVRSNANQYLIDRFLGKPKQSIEQRVGDLNELSDEQLTAIARSSVTATSSTS
jgi:hypothetical protein